MKKTIFVSVIAFLFLFGCTKAYNDLKVNPNENQFKSSINVSARTATEFGVWDDNGVWDNNLNVAVLRTSLWAPPDVYTAPEGYPVYVASNYDVMTHFGYFSPEAVTDAIVEFTFPHIKYFVPHITNSSEYRIYTVNNSENQTVITCTTNLSRGKNPMFCFLLKIDCGKGNSGYTTFWTDMKVNGVSVKGTIKNKVFACN